MINRATIINHELKQLKNGSSNMFMIFLMSDYKIEYFKLIKNFKFACKAKSLVFIKFSLKFHIFAYIMVFIYQNGYHFMNKVM